MFAWGSKYLFAVSLAALLGALVYGIASGGDIVGVLSSGYKGGVGDHFGYSVLLGTGLVTACLGVLNVMVREADIDSASETSTGIERALTVRPPRDPSVWGVLTGFGVACLALGFSIGSAFTYLGIAVLFVVALEWLVLAWSDSATGDAEANRVIRNRMLGPIEVPMFALLAIAVGVVGGSRVLLAVPHAWATGLASIFALVLFLGAVWFAKSSPSRSLIAGFVTVMAVAVLGGGVVGAVAGEYEHHDSEHGTEHEETSHDESADDESSDSESTDSESTEADETANEEN